MSYFKGFGNGSNSNGQFWYGRPQNFPGFLFKKNTGVGGRKNPLYGLICNKPTYIYNKYKPGTGGVGAQNRANRRAKNARATVCLDHECGRFYNYLGLYPRYSYRSIDGYFPYPLPTTYYDVNGDYKSILDTKFKNILVFTGNANFSVFGFRPITLNYIFIGGGGGGGAGGSNKGAGAGGGGGGQVKYGQYDILPGYHTIVVGEGGQGGESYEDFRQSSSGGNGGNSYIFKNNNGNVLINAYGGEGGKYGEGDLLTNGGVGGVSTGTPGSVGGENKDINGGDGKIGGGGGGTNYHTGSERGGKGAKNISIDNQDFLNIIEKIISNNTDINVPFDFKLNDLVQIFGTGGGAGNAAEERLDGKGGKSGKAGGFIGGEGGIGYTDNETGEDGGDAISYLGGGGGGGGGGATTALGGKGGNGGKGIIILFFNLL